jgi:hypothetical protein
MKGSPEIPWRPPVGRAQLGRYRLLAEIARGGIGTVYVGCADGPTGFRKLVAIKTLRPELAAEPALVRMLIAEAQVASRLHHPHIAQLYDLGDDGGPFLVMEYVHGESLSAVLATGAPPPRIGVSIAAQLCDALAYAHALRDDSGTPLGLVHRDVSPQNVVIDYEGVPRLLDFGIARAQFRASDTERGVIKGRLAYMAPEQRAGRRVDGRADLHALGIVLYQATVGLHPWELADCAEGIADPRPHRPGFPDALWAVIERATAADPERRFATADDMRAALRDVASELGPPVERGEVAALLDGPFLERRAAKQLLLGERAIDGDTEVLAPAGPRGPLQPAIPTPAVTLLRRADEAAAGSAGHAGDTNRGRREPGPARSRWRSGARVAAVLLAGLVVGSGWRHWSASPTGAPGALQRPCLVVETSGTLADRDAAWLAVRLVGLALDRHPRLQVRHGYRIQDREGWNSSGQTAAEQACVESDADGLVAIAARNGRLRASRNGQLLGEQATPGSAGAAALAEQLAALWSPSPAAPWRATLPDWPDRFLRPVLEVREGLVLQHPDVSRRPEREVLVRNHPQLEFVSLADVISRWWAGGLDDPAARAAMSTQSGTSERAEVLVAAIVDLAASNEARADAAVARLLEDARWAADPLTLYIGGEARIHSGRPAEGARLLERALAADPQLTPAIYHVADRLLAEGDWAGVERMAVLWDRVEPGSPHAVELRGAAMLGAGRYADASRVLESLIDRSRSGTAGLDPPQAASIYARLLAGDVDGALARARVASTRMGDYLPLAAGLPDPIIYAWALGRGDQALASEWEARLRQRLAGKAGSANYWQLVYCLAILDHLSGRPDARARWVGAGPPPSVPRRYRFAGHEHTLAVLEASGGDPIALDRAARDERDLPTFHLARALVAGRDGRTADEVRELESAMASSANGDFDCVAAALLVRIQKAAGNAAGAAAACERILVPRVPRPYCLLARRECMAAPAP